LASGPVSAFAYDCCLSRVSLRYAASSTELINVSVGADTIQTLISRVKDMNRRKKIKQLLEAHAKKASAKLAPRNKPKYVSKADRLKLAAEASQGSGDASEG